VSVTVVASVTGSPGATRLALGLAAAWAVPAHRRVLIEADPDGGRLGAELGVGVEPGLMALALAARTAVMTTDDVVHTGAAPVADWFLVPAPPSAEQTYSALGHAAPALADVMTSDDLATDWFVDAGRLTARSPGLTLARSAGNLLLVTHGSFAELQLVPHRVDALRTAGCRVEVVVVEPTQWSSSEVAEFVGAEVVGVLPWVRARKRDVAAMRGTAWRPWWNAVDDIVRYLAGDVTAASDLEKPTSEPASA
jgi:MinD-like ATPase involved in chromosome partitioning or flagellar assembly